MRVLDPLAVESTLQVGTTAIQAYETVRVGGTFLASAAGAYAISVNGTIPAGATGIYNGFFSQATMSAATAYSEMHHFDAQTVGAASGATMNVQTGFHARDMSTSNYGIGFRGMVASGTNKYNLYMDGNAQNYIEGAIGVGVNPPAAGIKLHIAGTAPASGAFSDGVYLGSTYPAAATSQAINVQSAPSTAAAAYTLTEFYHFNVNNITIGAGSAVTRQYGFSAQDISNAGTNYGFYSAVTAGSGKWGFFSNGSANNAFAGNTRFGSTTAPTAAVDVTGNIAATGTITGSNLSGTNTGDVTVNLAGAARQTVLTGSIGSTGLANALTTGSGLRPGLSATTKPMCLAFSAGFTATGASDVMSRLTADVADILGADLPARQTNFIHATWVSASSVTWGTTLAPPQYGEYFDRTRNVLCHFEGANGATTFTDDYGNTAQRVGTDATISTAQFKFGASSIRLNAGAGASCAEVLVDTPITNEGSWTLECFIRWNALPIASANAGVLFAGGLTSGVGMQIYLFNNSGTLNLRTYISSQNTSFNIASNSQGTKTTWSTGTWYHIAITYDAIDGTFYEYVDGVLDNTIVSATNWMQFIAKVRAGASGAATPANVSDCWVDEFRYSQFCRYPHGTTFTPTASAFAVEGDFYSLPEMKMYSVTSASASAGTDPGMTAVNRVYVGECATGASTISTATTYAYRGRYVGPWTTTLPGINVKTVFNHNLGVRPDKADFVVEWLMTDGSVGYQVGDRVKNPGSQNGTYYVETNPALTRISGSYSTLNSTASWFIAKGGGTSGGNSVECRYRFEAQRGW